MARHGDKSCSAQAAIENSPIKLSAIFLLIDGTSQSTADMKHRAREWACWVGVFRSMLNAEMNSFPLPLPEVSNEIIEDFLAVREALIRLGEVLENNKVCLIASRVFPSMGFLLVKKLIIVPACGCAELEFFRLPFHTFLPQNIKQLEF